MEMTVGTGKGYVSAEMNKPEEPPLGYFINNNAFFQIIALIFCVI